jgi:glycine hydroxymethyltransferase
MLNKTMTIAGFDTELAAAIAGEAQRQEEHIELIASENYTSPRVMAAQGSVLTNKYAEGYPGKRYYGGCEFVDQVETLAIERAKKLFSCGFANVQPHSGSQANTAAYAALLKPGETLLGMSLAHGGHLTHGANVSFSGRVYNAVQYGLNPETGEIDYEQMEQLAQEHKPKVIVAGFSAYSRFIDFARVRRIADSVGAKVLVDMAHVAGLVAAGLYPNPFPHAHVVTSTTHKTLCGPRGGLILAMGDDEELCKKLNFGVFPENQGGPLMHVIAAKAVCFLEAMSPEFNAYQQLVLDNAKAMVKVFQQRGFTIVSGGTDDHLFLLSLVGRDITGKEADEVLGRAYITVNKNAVPNDPRPPFVTSGIRIGTPAVTRRGFGIEEVTNLTQWICDLLEDSKNDALIATVKAKVLALCARFPVYG